MIGVILLKSSPNNTGVWQRIIVNHESILCNRCTIFRRIYG
jgi:hypothetical protein